MSATHAWQVISIFSCTKAITRIPHLCKTNVSPLLVQCCPVTCEAGPTSSHHWWSGVADKLSEMYVDQEKTTRGLAGNKCIAEKKQPFFWSLYIQIIKNITRHRLDDSTCSFNRCINRHKDKIVLI